MIRALNRALDIFERTLISIGLALATGILFANVIARYLLDTGITWALEAVQYLFAWVVLIGAAHGVKAGVHLGINILVERFSAKTQRLIAYVSLGLSLLFVVWVFILSIIYTMSIYRWGDLTLDLRIPQWIPYLAIPVGLGLMTLHFIVVGIEIFQGKRLRIAASEGDDYQDHKIKDVTDST